MENIAAQTIKDLLQKNPDCTLQEFIDTYHERCIDYVKRCHERDIRVLIQEFSSSLKKISENN